MTRCINSGNYQHSEDLASSDIRKLVYADGDVRVPDEMPSLWDSIFRLRLKITGAWRTIGRERCRPGGLRTQEANYRTLLQVAEVLPRIKRKKASIDAQNMVKK